MFYHYYLRWPGVGARKRAADKRVLSSGKFAVIHRPAPARIVNSVDVHMVAIMRCLLALLALGVTYLDPHHTRWIEAVYAVLLAYAAFGVALLVPKFRRSTAALARAQPWIDVAFCIGLVALTGGVDSIFFHFFFFAIIVASFSRGFREGFAVTMVAVLAFAAIGLAGYAAHGLFDLTQALTRTVSLFILGYMTSYSGGRDMASRRRLSLLQELSGAVNPRAGLDTLMANHLSRINEFFGASSCLLVFAKSSSDSTRLVYRADRSRPFAVSPPDQLSSTLAWPLLGLPPALCVSFDARSSWLPGRAPRVLAWETGKARREHDVKRQCMELANLLEAPAFASVPYQQTEGISGRLFLISGKRAFNQPETQFLAQVASQMATAVNNVMLTDELTINAAKQERFRISRGIHDTTVQSYIGLKLGLEALYRDIGPAAPTARRIKELLDMATLTVDDLRGYVDRLRGGAGLHRPALRIGIPGD